jgi:hypothetical protein
MGGVNISSNTTRVMPSLNSVKNACVFATQRSFHFSLILKQCAVGFISFPLVLSCLGLGSISKKHYLHPFHPAIQEPIYDKLKKVNQGKSQNFHVECSFKIPWLKKLCRPTTTFLSYILPQIREEEC